MTEGIQHHNVDGVVSGMTWADSIHANLNNIHHLAGACHMLIERYGKALGLHAEGKAALSLLDRIESQAQDGLTCAKILCGITNDAIEGVKK
jgi:hypothetical protein